MNQTTIAAVSTPMGNGGIGIVRISGDGAVDILKKIFVPKKQKKEYKSHSLTFGHIVNEKGKILDEVLVAVMLAPNTYTREDTVEINCHGGITCVYAVLELVLRSGAEPAQPGEFTKRAFLNGRIDLSQAEAVTEIINAKTEQALLMATQQVQGRLSQKIREYRERVLTLITHIEVSIDYPEHEEETQNLQEVSKECKSITQEIYKLIAGFEQGKLLKNGVDTVILGKPNAGKSSLLNMFLDEQRAIVTDIPGTTRDILQEYINLQNIPFKITDTAGIRETQDKIEQIGVTAALERANNADLIIFMPDGSRPLEEEEIQLYKRLKEEYSKPIITAVNKSDLPQVLTEEDLSNFDQPILKLSTETGEGFETLTKTMVELFFKEELLANGQLQITTLRHKTALTKAAEAMERALESITIGFSEDIAAIDLMIAYEKLGEILGESVGESVINKIFEAFCLGK